MRCLAAGRHVRCGWRGCEGLAESPVICRELGKIGDEAEQRAGKQVNDQVEVASGQTDEARSRVSVVKTEVAARIEKIGQAFDSRVAGALNRLGIPARQAIQTLSAKLDGLSALS